MIKRHIFPTMSRLAILVLFLITFTTCYGQIETPVNWKFSAKKLTGTSYELHFTASIQPPWHIYGKDAMEDLGAPTTITFSDAKLVVLDGPLKEIGSLVQKTDKTLGGTLKYYENQVDFVQTVKLKRPGKVVITGKVEFMACTDQRCLPPDERKFVLVVGK